MIVCNLYKNQISGELVPLGTGERINRIFGLIIGNLKIELQTL